MQTEAQKILRAHSIPFAADLDRSQVLLRRLDADPGVLRDLGFRISRHIGDQMVVTFKGRRVGLMI
jgi:hypothetical protein